MHPTPYQTAKAIEESSLNAWPALTQILYDGWVLRFAYGYSRRNNSVNAVYDGTLPIEEKIRRSEAVFRGKQLPPTFRMTPFVQPANLDMLLADANYEKVSPTSVQSLDLLQLDGGQNPSALDVKIWEQPNETWVSAYTQMNDVPVAKHNTLRQILAHIPLDTCFLTVSDRGQTVACGLGVSDGQYVGLFDIVTNPNRRGEGFGTGLVSSILFWAKNKGAQTAYLQVVVGNTAALKLYSKLGFREIYQYWYRVKS